MRPIRRTLAVDASTVLLVAATLAELWIGRRADATMVTTVLALGTAASLLIWRPSPAAAVLTASAAQAALLAAMPRPMISSAVALGAAAVIAAASATVITRPARWAAVIGPIAAISVAADYAFRIRTSGQVATFAIVVASLAVCWAFGHWVVRRLTAPPPAASSELVAELLAEVPAAQPDASADGAPGSAPAPTPAPSASSPQASAPTQRRVRGAVANEGALASEDAELAARRLAVAQDLAGTVTAGLNAILVETVAAQQGLVRDAHPEDVLVRLRAAEEHARTAIDDVRRLLTVAAVVPAATDDAMALDR